MYKQSLFQDRSVPNECIAVFAGTICTVFTIFCNKATSKHPPAAISSFPCLSIPTAPLFSSKHEVVYCGHSHFRASSAQMSAHPHRSLSSLKYETAAALSQCTLFPSALFHSYKCKAVQHSPLRFRLRIRYRLRLNLDEGPIHVPKPQIFVLSRSLQLRPAYSPLTAQPAFHPRFFGSESRFCSFSCPCELLQ